MNANRKGVAGYFPEAYGRRLENIFDAVRYAIPARGKLDGGARVVTDSVWIRRPAIGDADSPRNSIRGVVTADSELSPRESPIVPGLEGAVIYELHVGGFTRDPSSGVQHPGKFLGMIEKIPYLKELGITHVELLPVMAFDDQDVPPNVEARGLRNFWGYSPIFARRSRHHR